MTDTRATELNRIGDNTDAIRVKFDALVKRVSHNKSLNRAETELEEITAALDAQTDALLSWALRLNRRAKDAERKEYSVDEVADLLDMPRESVRVLFAAEPAGFVINIPGSAVDRVTKRLRSLANNTVAPPASEQPNKKPASVRQQYFNTRQAAEYLGKTVKSVEGYVARRILRPKKAGKLLSFSKTELDRFAG